MVVSGREDHVARIHCVRSATGAGRRIQSGTCLPAESIDGVEAVSRVAHRSTPPVACVLVLSTGESDGAAELTITLGLDA